MKRIGFLRTRMWTKSARSLSQWHTTSEHNLLILCRHFQLPTSASYSATHQRVLQRYSPARLVHTLTSASCSAVSASDPGCSSLCCSTPPPPGLTRCGWCSVRPTFPALYFRSRPATTGQEARDPLQTRLPLHAERERKAGDTEDG